MAYGVGMSEAHGHESITCHGYSPKIKPSVFYISFHVGLKYSVRKLQSI